MGASRSHLFVNFIYVPTGLFHLRQISKVKQYDAIDKKYVRGRVWFTRKFTVTNALGLVRVIESTHTFNA